MAELVIGPCEVMDLLDLLVIPEQHRAKAQRPLSRLIRREGKEGGEEERRGIIQHDGSSLN